LPANKSAPKKGKKGKKTTKSKKTTNLTGGPLMEEIVLEQEEAPIV
jgi:hypothetical protein